MVIFYDKNGEIVMADNFTSEPTFPIMSIEKKKKYYESIGLSFIAIDEELGGKVFDYRIDDELNLVKKEVDYGL